MPNWIRLLVVAAFWIYALAAQMSGFTSALIGVVLALLATLLLVPPAIHQIRLFAQNRRTAGMRPVEATDLIIAGVAGAAIFGVMGAVGVIWYIVQAKPSVAAPSPPSASPSAGQIETLQSQIQSLRSEIQHLSADADRGAKAARIVQLEEGIKKLEEGIATAPELMLSISRWYRAPPTAGPRVNRLYIPIGQLSSIFTQAQNIAKAAYPQGDIQIIVEPADILTRRAPDDDKITEDDQKYIYRKEYLKWQDALTKTNALLNTMKSDLVTTRVALSRQQN